MRIETSVARGRFSLKSLASDIWRAMVVRPMMTWQAWRCAQAKAYLLTHDVSYRMSYTGNEIVRRREKLYSEGVSPADSRIPDRWSIEGELPLMSWPNSK